MRELSLPLMDMRPSKRIAQLSPYMMSVGAKGYIVQ